MKRSFTNILKVLFFLGLGILLVWLAIRGKTKEEINNIEIAIRQADYFWIIVSVIISGLSHFFRALRWKILLKPLHHTPKTSNTFFAVMVGYLANLALPRLGEVTRCGVLARYENVPFVQGFGTVIAERALDVLCVILLFFITLGIEFDKISGIANDMVFEPLSLKAEALLQNQLFVMIGSSVLIISVLFFFYFRKKLKTLMSGKVKRFFKGLWDGIVSVKNVNEPKLFIAYTILIWLMYILQVYVCFYAFAEMNDLSFVVGMVITIFGGLAVAVVPGGTGVYQIIVIQILTTVYFIPDSASFAYAWAVWSSQIFFILFVGLISLVLLPILNKNKEIQLI